MTATPKFLTGQNTFSMTIKAPRLLMMVDVTIINPEGETITQSMTLAEALDRVAYAAVHAQSITIVRNFSA